MIIEKIEDAIVAAVLAAGIIPSGEVNSYAGEFDDDTFEHIRKLPAAWATFGGASRPKRSGANLWRYDATFGLIIAARSVKSHGAGRKGEAGVYALLDKTHKLLLRQDLDLPILELAPGAIRPLVNSRLRNEAIVAYTQEWHTAWVEKVPPEAGALWMRQGLSYYLKPGDDTADTEDLITLEQAA